MSASSRSPWPRVAMKLAGAITKDHLHPEVVALANGAGRRPWIVAVSGGADSVALLLLLWAHWAPRRDRLVLAHFDHRVRGAASAADARFCQRLADGLGVIFESGKWQGGPQDPSEAEARAARQQFLETTRRRHRARWIWTGHQLDDVAETLLMRLGRGSGTAGLSAPRPIQDMADGVSRRLRPLLELRSKEIRAALKAAGGRWREDQSNQSSRFLRNRVRSDLIPLWENAMDRDAVAGAGLTRRLLDEDNAALDAWLDEIGPIDALGRLSLHTLQDRPVAVWRRALRRWLLLQIDPGDLSRQGFENLLAMAQEGRTRRFSLGRSGFVRIRRGWLFFEQPSEK